MQDHTLQILAATLKADSTIGPAERTRLLKTIRGEPTPAPVQVDHESRIYSRKQTAELLGGRTTRYVSQLVKRGLLTRFLPRGNKRAIGITGESLRQFISGK
jgi:hypothetical protein